jgi:hypothetical protein
VVFAHALVEANLNRVKAHALGLDSSLVLYLLRQSLSPAVLLGSKLHGAFFTPREAGTDVVAFAAVGSHFVSVKGR